MKKIALWFIKFILGIVVFFASAVYVVILILGLWFINQADYRNELTQEEKAKQGIESSAEEKHQVKVNISKLPSDDQQEFKNSKVIKRTISRDDGKILQAVKYLNFFDNVQAEIELDPVKPICKIICDASSLDQERLVSDPYSYVEKFYIQNKNRALDDFYFRHALEATKVVALILTPRMREMYIHGLEIENKNIFEQIVYVTKFQFAAGQALYNISQLNKNFQNHEKKMSVLVDLRKTCEYTSLKRVQKACDEVLLAKSETELEQIDKPKVRPTVQAESESSDTTPEQSIDGEEDSPQE